MNKKFVTLFKVVKVLELRTIVYLVLMKQEIFIMLLENKEKRKRNE